MMAVRQTRRGGPLVALGAVMGCWVAARVVMAAYGGSSAHAELPDLSTDRLAAQAGQWPRAIPAAQRTVIETHRDAWTVDRPSAYPVPTFSPPPSRAYAPFAPLRIEDQPSATPSRPAPLPVGAAAGHQLMWMAALSRMPLPAGFGAAQPAPRAAPVPFYPADASRDQSRRWSADGWLLLRRGSGGSLAAGATPATYGASQAGAVVRYSLSPVSPYRPQAYARLSSALNAPADKELAIGLSARPVPALPLRAMAELRVADRSGFTRLRPAALVHTELQPVDLPYQTRAEFYGQAGYVGGRNATAFADGQARLDRHVARIGKAELRAGGGAWAGAQKGAARLDAGPSATLGVPVGESGAARLGLDWRLRVAGDAQPGSGVALTLSAGF